MGQQRAEAGWSEEKESLPLQEEELAGRGKGLTVGLDEGRRPGRCLGFWLGHPVGCSPTPKRDRSTCFFFLPQSPLSLDLWSLLPSPGPSHHWTSLILLST